MNHKLTSLLSQPNRATVLSILNLLDPITVPQRVPEGTLRGTKYGAVIHVELCRLKMLGFSDANCARGVGISPETLRNWLQANPQLQIDLEQAAQLSNAEVAGLLFNFMAEKGPVGLNAVKFFLSTRTEEFREKADVTVTATGAAELSTAIQAIYGIRLLSQESQEAVPSPQDALPPPPPVSEADLDLDELLQAPQTSSRLVPELPEEF